MSDPEASIGKPLHTSDVLIIGGGPAGSACARKLMLGGASAIILEKAEFPRSKPCAGWITPRVLQLLQPLFGNYPHSLTCFPYFDISIWGFRFLMPTNQYAIRRQEFDYWLLQKSRAKVIQHQVKDIQVTADGYLVDDQFLAPHLVGAGGTYCPVRKKLFHASRDTRLDPQESSSGTPKSSPESTARTENAASLIVALEDEFLYPHHNAVCRLWFFQDSLPGYAWYVPKADGYVNVGVGGKAHSLLQRGDSIKHQWDCLMERLAHEELVTGRDLQPQGHSYSLRGRTPRVQLGSAYLAGDAAGLATIDMGEGIGPAIQSGILAAEAILRGSEYKISSIPRYSFPSILGLRRESHTIALPYERR